MRVDLWFMVLFSIFFIIGPLTQFLQLVAPKLHRKMGLMEANAFKPEFKWYLLDERAIAIADMTYFVTGILFIIGECLGKEWSIPFGIFTCAIYIYFSLLEMCRWILLGRNNLNPISKSQILSFYAYLAAFGIFGVIGFFYLWRYV